MKSNTHNSHYSKPRSRSREHDHDRDRERDYYKSKRPDYRREERARERERERDRDRDRERERERTYEKERERDRERDRERERIKNIEKDLEKERNLQKNIPKSSKSPPKVSKWSDGPSKFTSKPIIPISQNNDKLPYSNIFLPNAQNNQSLPINPMPQITPLPIVFPPPDSMKIKKKIYIPKKPGINYVGLLIGPKGTYQKRLQQQSGCKILVRGKGTQKEGMPQQPDDNEEKHVLIIGDTEENIKRATHLVEKILFADDATRTKIKEEQIKASQEIRTELLLKDNSLPLINNTENGKPIIQDYLMTPYGPPDKAARFMEVPDDCVGLIIGKNGDTIRRLNRESACKIQIAIAPIPNTSMRYVFIEGPEEKYEIAKKYIEAIIGEQINMKQSNAHIGETNPNPGPYTLLKIPNKMVGLIIGRNGEMVKLIQESTNSNIFIPKEPRPGEDFRELQLSGNPQNVEICRREIISMIHLALYGRLPYLNSLFYPYIDPVTHLPIIDPGIMAQLDPNSNLGEDNDKKGKYDNFEKSIFQISKNEDKELDYDLENYNNPLNYDLYYQSMYQMYPQMNDYYKKVKSQDDVLGGNNQPLVLLNSALLDPNHINNIIESRVYSKLQQKDEDRINTLLSKNLKKGGYVKIKMQKP